MLDSGADSGKRGPRMNDHTTIRVPKALKKRVAVEAKLRRPRTNCLALASHYIENGVSADEAKRKEATK